MSFSMLASHAVGKGKEPDVVFDILGKANAAKATLGQDKVINGSIGAIFTEEEKFASFQGVSDYYRRLPDEELMNYAAIAGLPDYLQAAIDYTFGAYKPQGAFLRAVATPGGTGAIRNAFFNYIEVGQKALIPDWFWGPYKTIANEHQRDVETYAMFDENNNFTLEPVKEKVLQLFKVQDSVLTVFNTPGHNPTGHSVSFDEWIQLLDFYKECAADKKKKIILLLDIAYLDYVKNGDEARKFMQLFANLPENILVTIAFSMSKSFLLYGMRCGALIGVTSSAEVAEEFPQAHSYSARGVWSNGTRGAQKLLVDVMKNKELRESIDLERKSLSELILKRADIFVQEAKDTGLELMPYHGGFFISVPANKPLEAANQLMEDNIYVVPLKKGLRFAVCALPLQKIPGLAAKTKEVLSKL
ncbi:MAG: aminotransferase class I/II-fold pyridoxal phosphate-dependent enzyme [Clostridia bacterium]|jgi:aromatic-amino-acid transaminase|nr:aminotransferase class I/II-fold pyridoxal phosphate-dependent enzyme [Clostridia bacterium]